MKYFVVVVILIFCLPAIIFCQKIAQDVLATSGDEFKSNNFSINWTIGESISETFVNTTVTATQGFHQGNLIISGDSELIGSNFSITVFPNPTSEYVEIKLEAGKTNDLNYILYNMDGTMLLPKSAFSEGEKIDMRNLVSATYLLAIFDREKKLKVFTIIKE